MTGAEEQRSGSGRDPNLLGLLSLQLLMLAFFILLVSLSTFDSARVRSVLGSVQAVFASTDGKHDGPDQVNRADAIVLDSITDEIEGVLATALQLDRVERTGRGAATFEMAADALFAVGSAQLAPGRDEVLRRVAAALDRRPAGYRAELELLVGHGGPAASGEAGPALPQLEIARAGAIARAAEAAGATPSGIAAGLLPQAPNRVRIVLRLTDRPRPADLFGAAAAAQHPREGRE